LGIALLFYIFKKSTAHRPLSTIPDGATPCDKLYFMTENKGKQKIDFDFYLNKFQVTADLFRKKLSANREMEVATGIYSESVYLKLYKKTWANQFDNPHKPDSMIFFSVWLNEKAIREGKIYYNIHAFKLRHLRGYFITSRKFADNFRTMFKRFANQWPNVSIDFGPQTLMQGWRNFDLGLLENRILELSAQFLKIEKLIDKNLQNFKKEIIL
jgi:hypothetical protein